MSAEEIHKIGPKKPRAVTAIITLSMVMVFMFMLVIFVYIEDNTAMVIGFDVLCCGTFFALAVIIFYSICLIKIGYKGLRSGKGYAITGLLAGIAGIIYFADCHAGERPRRVSCAGNLKQIGLAILMYSQENNNQFPDKSGASGLEMLRSGGYLENVKLFSCPSTNTKLVDNNALTEEVDYAYIGGYNKNTPPDTAIAYDKSKNHYKFVNILFADGHVSGYTGANWINNRKKK